LLEAYWDLRLYAALRAIKDGLVERKASLLSEELFEQQNNVTTLEDLPTPQGMPTSLAIAE
jgi:hypothetical protein